MSQAFGENVAPTAAISAILGSYPFSIGLLRELLQNSDDAGATKQIFVLDRRTHRSAFIYHSHLAKTQGPALLAYNNELINEDDWQALQNIHRSSKTADTSKIGKYGLGFRSCYHVTDNPHILSGSHLAILDPQHEFAEFHGIKTGGVKFDFVQDGERFKDHLSSFNAVIPPPEIGRRFNGSIFRLPLRKYPSEIGNQSVSPDEIALLLKNFALEELNIALLFLRNVASIEIYEIDIEGERMDVASVTIDRSSAEFYGQFEIWKAIVCTSLPDSLEEREWRIIHAPFSETEAIEVLSERLGGNPTTTLSRHKLSPTVDFAIPLNSPGMTKIGRLFTFLPLPLMTEFPVHINALFSLTQSRQNLRNSSEIGMVKSSDDHALIEWNRLLFDTYIPQTWAALLEVLAQCDQVAGIFDAWPTPQADVQSGDNFYWKEIVRDVARCTINLLIWPHYGRSSPTYGVSGALLMAESSTPDNVLTALVRTGLEITKPPHYITKIILNTLPGETKFLSPKSAHSNLLSLVHRLNYLDDEDIEAILEYLLSTYDCTLIVGLPLLPSVSGNRVTLDVKKPVHSSPPRILLDETEESLFGVYDSEAISLQRLTSDVRCIVLAQGLNVLNIVVLESTRTVAYLKASPYAVEYQGVPKSSHIDWLNQFWDHAQESSWDLGCFDQFFLVPTTKGLQRPTCTVFGTEAEPTISELLEMLGVAILDTRMNMQAQRALRNLFSSSNIHALLHALPKMISAIFTEDQAIQLSSYFIRHLPSSSFTDGPISTNPSLRSRLRSIPMYPLLSDNLSSVVISSIPSFSTVRGVDLTLTPVLPRVPSIVWINLESIKQDILQYLDPHYSYTMSANEMHELMLKHFQTQSSKIQLAFIQYLVTHSSSVPRGTIDRLGGISFVLASDGNKRAPKDLIDPDAPLAQLYPGASPSIPDTSQLSHQTIVNYIRRLDLFITELSLDILRDRIKFISGRHASDPEELAKTLINYITRIHFDCRHLFDSTYSIVNRSLKWIPASTGLECPLTCRDTSSHYSQDYLFDEVMPMVKSNVHVGDDLRKAFQWDVDVPFDVLVQQLLKVLDSQEPQYPKVQKIVEHLGHRTLKMSDLSSLRAHLQDLKWIPTRQKTLISVNFALLGGEDIPAVGFYSVPFDSNIRKFFYDMGCVDRPSKETILRHLQLLYDSCLNEPVGRAVTLGCIRLLGWLPRLTSSERTRLIIPDTNGVLRSFGSICFNDIGSRACLVNLDNNFLAHPNISDGLANDLALRRLGFVGVENRPEDDLDMGEDLVTTIRNRLREYTDSQLLLEFLANASDAGATEFKILHDEQDTPDTFQLLSKNCQSFQHVPALVIYNNSIFTDEDFSGILRTGIGGKAGKRDTIGHFGLGALTMFHITEFAMIISRDSVLFLNPCRAHLSLNRAALRLPLSIVRRLYGDHLIPVIKVFGFNPPDDVDQPYTYHGTIFRLPVRAENQFLPNVEPIFRRPTILASVISSFKDVASKCLVFTSIASIQCSERRFRTTSLSWSVTASRVDLFQTLPHISLQTTSISESLNRGAQEWRVFSLTVNETDHPALLSTLQEQYRLRHPIIVRMATCSIPGSHCLFSTLPLPIDLDLPVHISAPFILASDRRSIRLDHYGNNEASYNQWLLETIIPTLYLHILADRSCVADNAIFWPGSKFLTQTNECNVISTMVMDAVFKMVASTELPVFRSKFHARALSPRDAYLMYFLPTSVSEILNNIRPSDIIKLPSPVARRLRADGQNAVDSRYLHNQIKNHLSRSSLEMLTIGQVQDVINFLLKDTNPFDSLNGLLLLPLRNGKFVQFGSASGSCFYVVPSAVAEEELFPSNSLIHGDLDTTKLLDVTGLNVRTVNDKSVCRLLGDCVPLTPTFSNPDFVTQERIKKFWRVFPFLSLSPFTGIADYPLIPTQTAGLYHSLNYCKASDVIVADTVETLVSTCLTQMGFTLINASALPKEIRSVLVPTPLTFDIVVSKLFTHPRSLKDIFNRLDMEAHCTFTSWIRSNLTNKKKKWFTIHRECRDLPLWRSANGSFVSAVEARMLPLHVPLDSVSRFTSLSIVEHHHLLVKMGARKIFSIRAELDLIPARLKPDLDETFVQLVSVLLAHSELSDGIPVPNSQRAIIESSQLYSSREDFFVAAFGSDSEHFILPTFRKFEDRLGSFGLIQKRKLNIGMFRNCVEAFQNVTEDDLRDRAGVIYITFSEDLPLHASNDSELQWKTLDHLRFIPRNMSPQPLPGIDATQHIDDRVKALPDVVSPNKLVRAEFMPIAWTQRALYGTEPLQRLIMVHPGLSVPTAEEVVDHLGVLATSVAPCHLRNRTLVCHLERTYKWLDEHARDARFFLQLKAADDICLFLNVDDPTNAEEEWIWRKADHILLDDYDTGFLQCPRDFLKPFSSLLSAAGAVTIDYGEEVQVGQKPQNDKEWLSKIVTGFEKLKRENICTDVNFVCDPPNNQPLSAHRVYLAAYTSHFHEMFSGTFAEAGDASSVNPIIVSVSGYSRNCVKNILDFLYTMEEPRLERTESDTDLALEMLTLANSWSMMELHSVLQDLIIRLKMVDLFNIEHVLATAESVEATKLKKHCKEYKERNKAQIERAKAIFPVY